MQKVGAGDKSVVENVSLVIGHCGKATLKADAAAQQSGSFGATFETAALRYAAPRPARQAGNPA